MNIISVFLGFGLFALFYRGWGVDIIAGIILAFFAVTFFRKIF